MSRRLLRALRISVMAFHQFRTPQPPQEVSITYSSAAVSREGPGAVPCRPAFGPRATGLKDCLSCRRVTCMPRSSPPQLLNQGTLVFLMCSRRIAAVGNRGAEPARSPSLVDLWRHRGGNAPQLHLPAAWTELNKRARIFHQTRRGRSASDRSSSLGEFAADQ